MAKLIDAINTHFSALSHSLPQKMHSFTVPKEQFYTDGSASPSVFFQYFLWICRIVCDKDATLPFPYMVMLPYQYIKHTPLPWPHLSTFLTFRFCKILLEFPKNEQITPVSKVFSFIENTSKAVTHEGHTQIYEYFPIFHHFIALSISYF